ncbi:hypothetical protein PV762_27475 [Mitsuaria sp. CC2]|uniref:hypothetical protein n=1 Tax=Mitsuaria sp. CC2 TaxID=3029186 RepID=UPI003B8DA5BD
MRPIDKGSWPTWKKPATKKLSFDNWKRAIPHLKARTGWYCHLCEMRVNNHLSIEHIKSRDDYPILAGNWTNFVLSCGCCNSRKRARKLDSPYRQKYVWPHIHNTLMAFDVPLTGPVPATVQPNGSASAAVATRAQALIDLYALDAVSTKDGAADIRHIERLEAVQMAATRRVEFANGKATPEAIVDMAKKSGFFSVWFKVFSNVPQVQTLLVQEPAFHLNAAWFDQNLVPVARLPAEGV